MKIKAKLDEYRQEMNRRYPDAKWTILVIKDRGWITYPTGLKEYVVSLMVTSKGYKPKNPSLNIGIDGSWYIL